MGAIVIIVTESEIQQALLQTLSGVLLCNTQFMMGGEQDVIQVTPSWYINEFEIKISRKDYKADFHKKASFWSRNRYFSVKKHDLLSGEVPPPVSNVVLPRRFTFVLPSDLASQVDIPEYAGLIVYNGESCSVEKKAPVLPCGKKAHDRAKYSLLSRLAVHSKGTG